MRIQTNITDDDFEILTDFCDSERVSVSAIMNALVTDFLDTTDTEYRKKIINEALKIRQGRPKGKEDERK